MSDIFNDLYEIENDSEGKVLKPLYAIKYQNDQELMKWVKLAYSMHHRQERDRTRNIKDNYRMYKGELEEYTSRRRSDATGGTRSSRKRDSKLSVNFMKQLVQEHVNKLLELKPAIDVLPVHNEHEDKIAARVVKNIIDTKWYEDNFDAIMRDVTTRTKIAGEHYLAVLWDKHAGPIAPQYSESLKAIEELEKRTNKKINAPIKKMEEQRIGEICYKHIDTRKLIVDPTATDDPLKEGKWVIWVDKKTVTDLEIEYPKSKGKITEIDPHEDVIEGVTHDLMNRLQSKQETIVLHLFHKDCKQLPGGFQATLTLNRVLESCKLKYSHGKIPIIRRTDKDIPNQVRAESFMEDIRGLQNAHNELSSMIIANQRLFAYPKWFAPQGSVNEASLGAGRTIVQYRGSQPPIAYTPSPTPNEVFNFRSILKEDLRSTGAGSANEPGQAPAGVTAGVALQFLNEQDNKRYNVDIGKHFDFIREVALLTASTAAQYYDKDDGRLVKIIGRNNEHTIDKIQDVDLNRVYDIRIVQSNALADTKSARTQTIIDLSDKIEGLFTREQLVDLLELGDSQKMFDSATAAVKAAESIIEDILQGKEVTEPQPYENLIVHWKIFMSALQQRSFKEQTPEENQVAAIDYLKAIELLMIEKSQTSPAFMAELQALSLFPAVFQPEPPPEIDAEMMPEIQEGDPQGQPLADPSRDPQGGNEASPEEEVMINSNAE